MVVTRSSVYNKSRGIFTTSAKEAAIKSYKIYANASVSNRVATAATEVVQSKPSPSILRRSTRTRKAVDYSENKKAYRRSSNNYDHDDDGDDDDDYVYDEEEVANTLLSLNEPPLSSSDTSSVQSDYNDDHDHDRDDATTEAIKHNQRCADNCINPMTPIVRYAYCFTVSDPSRQQHYASCYMIYNEKTRNYHLLNKTTTLVARNPATSDEISPHTLLTNYTTYSTMSVQAYILNILTTPQHHYCISAQFIGLVLSDDKFRSLYDANACFYDIDSLMRTNSSTETLTGRELFILTPPTLFSNETFTASHIQCVFDILSRNT
jgi:hypothetical protein